MRTDPLDHLPSIPKIQVMGDFKAQENAKKVNKGSSRRPTLALKIALSVFGNLPKSGFVPMEFFAKEDVQLYLGLPSHTLNKLVLFSGNTSSRKIAQDIFPLHHKREMAIEQRLATHKNLPAELETWVEPTLDIIKKIRQDGWNPPPLYVLNFSGGKNGFRLIRAEHLCGQVLDGTHRVLAYSILGAEFPERPIPITVLHIHSFALAIINCLTIFLRFCMDPFRTPSFLKKRFEGSARFMPLASPTDIKTTKDSSHEPRRC